jgi:hypothetical protein
MHIILRCLLALLLFCGPVLGAIGDLGSSSPAANSADELFEIGEGVRRSKAAEILKKESIPARIIREGQAEELRDLPLTSLRSPREVIDASTLTDAERMASVLEGTRKGTVPPIDVRPGSRGTPIKDVKIKYPGSR